MKTFDCGSFKRPTDTVDCDLNGRKVDFTNSTTFVGVATDRGARNACLRFLSLYFFCVFFFFCVSFHFIFPVFFFFASARKEKSTKKKK